MNQRSFVKKAIKITLIVIFAFSVISSTASAVIFRLIFPRVDQPAPPQLCYDDIDSSAYPREMLSFESGGNTLIGCLYGDETVSKALVVISGGLGADLDAHLPEIIYFVDKGFSVFSYSGSGVGESEGGFALGLSAARRDLDSAIDCLSSLTDLPLVLYGHSAGAYAAAVAAKREDVRAAVCLSGFDSPTETMYSKARSYVGVLADIEYPFMLLEQFFIFGADGFDKASDSLLECSKPVMLIRGAYDETVPYELSISYVLEDQDNDSINFVTVDSKLRGSHSALWLSEESAKYRLSLKDSDDIDPQKANILDIAFMEDISEFYLSAL